MVTGCPAACGSCHLRSFEARCKRTEGQTPVLAQPGDLGRLLAHATSPAFAHLQPRVVHTNPTVIVFDAFLTAAEAAALAKEAGHDFKPSAEGGSLGQDGSLAELDGQKDQRRTSESSFCTGPCDAAAIVARVQARVGNLTGIAKPNFEFIQAVKYREGQRYVQHHDNNEQYFKMPMGPRVLTFFLYLAPSPAQPGGGGETAFPELRSSCVPTTAGGAGEGECSEGVAGEVLRVQPRVGRAVLWPNVRDDDPGVTDYRTVHEALPVVGAANVKVGANFWIYNYDYRAPWRWGCTG
jgi:hypothetical protein